jgi:hypothetical protein
MTIRLLVSLLLILLAGPVLAQTPCVLHECSDDTLGVYGNEIIQWDPVTPQPTRYQIFRELPESWVWWKMHCMDVPGNQPTAFLTNSKCLKTGPRVLIYVRACNGAVCGPLSNPVEFIPPPRGTAND